MASHGEETCETCAGYRIGGVNVTSIVAKKDLERRVSK
jgi:hypothetical protein